MARQRRDRTGEPRARPARGNQGHGGASPAQQGARRIPDRAPDCQEAACRPTGEEQSRISGVTEALQDVGTRELQAAGEGSWPRLAGPPTAPVRQTLEPLRVKVVYNPELHIRPDPWWGRGPVDRQVLRVCSPVRPLGPRKVRAEVQGNLQSPGWEAAPGQGWARPGGQAAGPSPAL